MYSDLQYCLDNQVKLDRFKKSISDYDIELLSKFDLILSIDELEIRGGTAGDQYRILCRIHILQRIATPLLNVEIAIYGSVFSFYPTDRIGSYI